MNNYKTSYSLPAGLKPASVENSGFVLPVFSIEMLFVFSGMAGQKAREESRKITGVCKKTRKNEVIGLFIKEKVC